MVREKHSVSCKNSSCPFYQKDPKAGEVLAKIDSIPSDCPLKADIERVNSMQSDFQKTYDEMYRNIVPTMPDFSYLFPSKQVLDHVTGVARVAESIGKIISPMQDYLAAHLRMMESVADSLSVVNQLKPVFDFSNIFGDFFRAINIRVGEMQWGWAEELFTDDGNSSIVTHLKSGNLEKFEEEVLAFYSKQENIEKMKNQMFSEKIFDGRKHLIEDALWAHSQGKYNLSVPVLIAQIEGIVWDFGEDLGFVQGQMVSQRQGGQPTFRTSVNPVVAEFTDAELDIRVKNHLSDVMVPFVRNKVQHGREKDYGTEINSVKAILFAYVLYYYIKKYRNSNSPTPAS